MAEDINFTQYIIRCSTCGDILTRTAYIDDDMPTSCPDDSSHDVTIIKSVEYSGFYKRAEKGEVYLKQFLRQHMHSSGTTDFGPMTIAPPSGKILELTQVDVIWHEKLRMNAIVVWEVRMNNPFYDPNSTTYPYNSPKIAVSQFFYRDFSELWGGAYARPVSDGPTREMQHRFADRNSKDNTNPFQLKSSLGMEIYAYAIDNTIERREPGEGISYDTFGGLKVYRPYQELTITSGKYPPEKAASYPIDFFPACTTDDCYSLNAIGSIFDEV